MGCDIHCFAEVKRNNKWEKVGDYFTIDEYDREFYGKEKGDSPFNWRSYFMFTLFSNVRNTFGIRPISYPMGLPEDLGYEVESKYLDMFEDAHSASYLTLKELLKFNYDKGEAYRDYLGKWFFIHLEELKTLGDPENVRIVFWFDN